MKLSKVCDKFSTEKLSSFVTVCLLKKKGKKDYLNKNIIITSNQEPTNDDSNIIKANYKKF